MCERALLQLVMGSSIAGSDQGACAGAGPTGGVGEGARSGHPQAAASKPVSGHDPSSHRAQATRVCGSIITVT